MSKTTPALTTDEFVTLLRRLRTSFAQTSVWSKALRTTEEGEFISADIWRQWKTISFAALEKAVDGFVRDGAKTPSLAEMTARASTGDSIGTDAAARCEANNQHVLGLDVSEFLRDAPVDNRDEVTGRGSPAGYVSIYCASCLKPVVMTAEAVWEMWELGELSKIGYPGVDNETPFPASLPDEMSSGAHGQQILLPSGDEAPVPY